MEKRGIFLVSVIILVIGFALGYIYSSYRTDQQYVIGLENSYNSLGWQLYYQGGYEAAIEEFKKYIERDDENYFAYSGLGWSYLEIQDYDNAITHFKQANDLDGTQLDSFLGLGWTYIGKGQQQFLEGNIKSPQENMQNAITHFSNGLTIDPHTNIFYSGLGTSQYWLELTKFQKERNFTESRENILKANQFYPNSFGSFNMLGWINYREKNYTESIKNFEKANKLLSNIFSFRGLGAVSYALRNYDDASSFFVKSIEKNPDSWEDYSYLGWAYFHLGEFDKAIVNFEKTIEIKPWYYSYNGLGWTYLRKDDEERAFENFQKALEFNDQKEESYLGLAVISYNRNNLEESRVMIDEYLSAKEVTGYHNSILAECIEELGTEYSPENVAQCAEPT